GRDSHTRGAGSRPRACRAGKQPGERAMSTGSSAALPAKDDTGGPLYGFGAVPLGDGDTRFRLWAPGAREVALLIRGQEPRPMAATHDGFHELVCHAEAGTVYRFGLPDGSSVPDPASRMQDGDVHDASIVCDPASYSWRF